MKKITIAVLVLAFCGFGCVSANGETRGQLLKGAMGDPNLLVDGGGGSGAEQFSIEVENPKAEKSDTDIIELEAGVLKWKHKYYTELLRGIALEYTGLCFKDKRWIDANQEIERINLSIQQLIKRSSKK